jgi:hypothetical protein
VEPGLLAGIKTQLLDADAIMAAVKIAHRLLNQQKPAATGKRQAQLRSEIANLTDAIAGGALKFSPAIAARLSKAEQELAQLEAAATTPKAAKLLPGFADRYPAVVSDLETILSPEELAAGKVTDRDIARAPDAAPGVPGRSRSLKAKSASRPRPVPKKWRCAWPEADRFLW